MPGRGSRCRAVQTTNAAGRPFATPSRRSAEPSRFRESPRHGSARRFGHSQVLGLRTLRATKVPWGSIAVPLRLVPDRATCWAGPWPRRRCRGRSRGSLRISAAIKMGRAEVPAAAPARIGERAPARQPVGARVAVENLQRALPGIVDAERASVPARRPLPSSDAFRRPPAPTRTESRRACRRAPASRDCSP